MNTVDVSSWLLFEDSADSEADSGFSTLHLSIAAVADADEDDAESCISDKDGIYDLPMVADSHEDDQEVEFSSDEDDRNFCSSTVWLSDAALGCICPLALEDEGETKMTEVNINELEDRLFWETCIAVGYP
ncbi:hypothetical protein L6164_012619 [Bauhinia variegata]|uniref:Uncharacterized protein n=1 Tax=Bauhinia variegata TaxID=167791 RepID=A0ACB9PA37_BAUVA|nr:hypothetical protein L6164_012619 [Bauhinia variegata]